MKHTFKRILALLLVLFCILNSTCVLAEEDSTEERMIGVVTGGKLKMRSEPSSDGRVLDTFSSGTEVIVLSNNGNWCKVEKNGIIGYMMSKYLEITSTYTHYGWGATPDNGLILNLRKEPDQQSPIVAKCFSGAYFELLGKADGWYYLRTGNTFGYLESDYIEEVSGNYSTFTYADSNNPHRFDTEKAKTKHEFGSQKSMSMQKGGFSYSVSYPVLALGIADAEISSFIRHTIDTAQQDFLTYHADSSAELTLNYFADQLDENFATVVLQGVYQVAGCESLPILHAMTVDLHTGELLDLRSHLTDPTRVLFQIESKIGQIFGGLTPTDNALITESLLDYSTLTSEGISFYFDAGRLMPIALGAQCITIPYMQSGDYIALNTPVVNDNKRYIDPTKPMIALTFDDGPSEETLRILEALEKYGGRATFCVVGTRLEEYESVLRATVASGNEIATHTWSHKKLTDLSNENAISQISRVVDMVRDMTGYEIKVLRPPYGSNDKRIRSLCADMGLIISHWTVDTEDWITRSESKTYRNIINGAENGTIILCHDIYDTTADAAINAIPELIQEGYQLVTVSELLSFHKEGVTPGTTYARIDPENIDTTK